MRASETHAQYVHVVGLPQGKFCISQHSTFFVWCSEEFMSTTIASYNNVNVGGEKKKIMETNEKKLFSCFLTNKYCQGNTWLHFTFLKHRNINISFSFASNNWRNWLYFKG